MLKVNLLLNNFVDWHTSKVEAGLLKLQQLRRIKLNFEYNHGMGNYMDRFSVMLYVSKSLGDRKLVYFDLRDTPIFRKPALLELCDICFKRSYQNQYINELPKEYRQKIRPYGLNYACSFPSGIRNLVSMSRRGFRDAAWLLRREMKRIGLFRRLPRIERFELPPYRSFTGKVLFLTRTWSPESTRMDRGALEKLNNFRANIIRLLRSTFGEKAVVGFADTLYARRNYPDCITNLDTTRRNYIRIMRECDVAVTSIGLHTSTGWKLPEYLAASKAVVTEPLQNSLPTPLVQGENMLTYSTPEECVDAVSMLLEDKEMSSKFRHNNYLYYRNEVEPSAHVYKRLIEVRNGI